MLGDPHPVEEPELLKSRQGRARPELVPSSTRAHTQTCKRTYPHTHTNTLGGAAPPPGQQPGLGDARGPPSAGGGHGALSCIFLGPTCTFSIPPARGQESPQQGTWVFEVLQADGPRGVGGNVVWVWWESRGTGSWEPDPGLAATPWP